MIFSLNLISDNLIVSLLVNIFIILNSTFDFWKIFFFDVFPIQNNFFFVLKIIFSSNNLFVINQLWNVFFPVIKKNLIHWVELNDNIFPHSQTQFNDQHHNSILVSDNMFPSHCIWDIHLMYLFFYPKQKIIKLFFAENQVLQD